MLKNLPSEVKLYFLRENAFTEHIYNWLDFAHLPSLSLSVLFSPLFLGI